MRYINGMQSSFQVSSIIHFLVVLLLELAKHSFQLLGVFVNEEIGFVVFDLFPNLPLNLRQFLSEAFLVFVGIDGR